ncbi:MAG: CHASE3 domain-containing protein [Polyangiaceae bacterium]|nr:CHASE3 domain-containing protein [Polyangiaceae bacterium]MCB9607580.1 CHASE3 domain-containing protein [Polyangiaceae bacterium]
MKRLRANLAVAASVVVLVVGGVTAINMSNARERSLIVQESHERLQALDNLLQVLLDAETGQRGYLITGEKEYLEPYSAALRRLSAVRKEVRELNLPAAELKELEKQVDARLDELAYTVKLFDSAGQQRAGEFVKQDAGKRTMDLVRAALARLTSRESERREAALTAEREAYQRNQLVVGGGALIAFVIAFLAQLVLRRDLAESAEQARTLREQAALLSDQADQLRNNEAELAERLRQQHQLTDELAEQGRHRERLIQSLGRANRDLDQFAYVTSHDLKAPLRGIASLASFIEEDLEDSLDDETRENLALLHQRVSRMESLIEGILTYSRAGRRTPPEDVPVKALLDEVVDLLSPEAYVEVKATTELPSLHTERVPLQQVLLNLVGNAIKHGNPEQCQVAVSAERVPEGWKFRIADNGPGIEERFHERIFGFFERLKSRDEVEGSGIGLAVVKKIVEERGGRVWVESEFGQGAAFYFVWPRASLTELHAVRPEDVDLQRLSADDRTNV